MLYKKKWLLKTASMKIAMTPFFIRVRTSVQNLTPGNVKICGYSIFPVIEQNMFNDTLKIRFLLILMGDV